MSNQIYHFVLITHLIWPKDYFLKYTQLFDEFLYQVVFLFSTSLLYISLQWYIVTKVSINSSFHFQISSISRSNGKSFLELWLDGSHQNFVHGSLVRLISVRFRHGFCHSLLLAHANGLLNLANHSFWDLVIPDGLILELLGDLNESVLEWEDVTEGAEVGKGWSEMILSMWILI